MAASRQADMDPLKIIFAGTPDFAAHCLHALIPSKFCPIAVLTQPDRPAGRGQKLQSSAVKQLASTHHIPVLQPHKLTADVIQQQLRPYAPDLLIVVAYGLILPTALLTLPTHGCINVHASLLPRWRGAAPIQRAIMAGDTLTGITIMQMDEGLDTGEMLLRTPCPIAAEETGGTLHDRLARLGAQSLTQVLAQLQSGKLSATSQTEIDSCYANKINKSEALINWRNRAIDIHNLIRAFNPWPVARTHLHDKLLRILTSNVLATPSSAPPGTIEVCDAAGIEVATGDHLLRLTQVQLAGKRAVEAAQFARQRALLGRQLGACDHTND